MSPMIFRVGVLILMFSGAAFAQTTRPTTRPVDRTSLIRQWFSELNHSNPDVRDRARYELLGLNRDELAKLKQIVQATEPLAPAQATELHDIVVHCFLAGEPRVEAAAGEPVRGFFGLFWPSAGNIQFGESDTPAVRLIGCPAFRALQEGDLIKGVRDQNAGDNMSREELLDAIRVLSPGDVLRLRVLRRGAVREISVTLEARPADLQTFDPSDEQRLAPAEDYWKREFAPLVADRTL